MTKTMLDKVQMFLENNVAPTIQLQAPSDDDVIDYTLVNPAVHIGWLPPKGLLPEGMDAVIPCLVVQFDKGRIPENQVNYDIRITAVVYSPGLHEIVDGVMVYTPDFKGYTDLLNLIDRTVLTINQAQTIEGMAYEKDSLEWAIYEESAYPYWYGYIKMTIKTKAVNNYSKNLD